MFKRRLLPAQRTSFNIPFRFYGRWFLFNGSIGSIILLTFLWLRTERQSVLKDLSEFRAEELNEALKRLPIVDESRDSWTSPRVEGVRILSAYLDTRTEVVLEEDPSLVQAESTWAMIRIVGIVPIKMEYSPLTCHYRYKYRDTNKTYSLSRRAIGTRLAAFQENFGMFYCAAFILCELPGRENSDKIHLPYDVSVSSSSMELETREINDEEFVVVRYPKNGWKNPTSETTKNVDKSGEKSIAVCIQPLHHRFDKAVDLLAFVEYYRMMGADRFTFYRDNVSPEVDKILDYYAKNDVATVINWRLSKFYDFERNLRVDGIFAALNDCLYRSSFHDSYRYVAGVDVDEYIVPRKHEDIASMMNYLNDPSNAEAKIGAWIFRNMFFYLMLPDDSTSLRPDLPRLKIHTKTSRWQEINRARDRSKYIVQGRDIIDMGNHNIWKLKRTRSMFGTRYKEVAVDPEIAGSQHYRRCETNAETCWQRLTVRDRTARRFTAKLAERVANVSNEISPLQPLWNR